MMNEFEKAYRELLKKNTQLEAQVHFWRNQAMQVSASSIENAEVLCGSFHSALDYIKACALKNGSIQEIIALCDDFRPLVVQSQVSTRDTRL